ncbi:MAG TPA: hypothetical protein VFM39_07390, partial [bacterium]|nr:hypothetical protein [bacterium]
MIRITAPLVFLALGVLPLVVLALRGRGRRRALVVLRMAAIALLVASAAGMEVRGAVRDLTVVLAVDRSDSIGPDGARLIRTFVDDV